MRRASDTEQVVVTARRRAETAQKVPQALIAFSQKTLTAKQIQSVFDLNRAVPGLTVDAGAGNPSLVSFSIRGRGFNYGAAAGSVETYFADVPLSAPFATPTLPPELFDLQSLQVLKGPQGTLFGRSTTGGAVLIVPQAPTNVFGGYARLQGGSYGDFQFEGAVNIPLDKEGDALRISGFDWQRDGYIHAVGGLPNALDGTPIKPYDYDNEDVQQSRVSLLLKPLEGLTNTTILSYTRDASVAATGNGLTLFPTLIHPPYSPLISNRLGAYYQPGYGSRYAYIDEYLNTRAPTESFSAINTTTYDLNDSVTLKNIFGYIYAQGSGNLPDDALGNNLPAADVDLFKQQRLVENTQFTNEFQVQGRAFNDRLTWVVGGIGDLTREPGKPSNINIQTYGIEFDNYTNIFAQNEENSGGLFGSATYKILPNLELTGGYRHSWDDVKLGTAVQESLTPLSANPVVGQAPIIALPFEHLEHTFQGDAADVNLADHVTKDVTVYGGWRLGYKHGGFNPDALSANNAEFGVEKVNDFTIGLKSDLHLAGIPIRFNIEGYYDLYKGSQADYYAPGKGGIAVTTTNVPRTTFRGFDTDLVVQPTGWLTVEGNYTLIDAFNTSWTDPTDPTHDLSSNPVPFASRNKVSVTTRFHTELPGDRGEIVFAPRVSAQGKYYTTPVADVIPTIQALAFGEQFSQAAHGGGFVPGYTLVDLRVEWNRVMGSQFDAAVNATNITDKQYFLGESATLQFGGTTYGYGAPTMINFEVSRRF